MGHSQPSKGYQLRLPAVCFLISIEKGFLMRSDWNESRMRWYSRPGTRSFRYKSFRCKSKSIRYTCKVDSIQTHVTWSCFDTEYYYCTIYKWLERTFEYILTWANTNLLCKWNKPIPSRTSNACTQACSAMRTRKRDQVLVKFIYREKRFI